MKPEEYLKKLQADYENTLPSRHLLENGWSELKSRLEPKSQAHWLFMPLGKYTLAFTSVVILAVGLSLGLSQVAQASLPGDTLYPIKRLSENILYIVSSDPQIKIDNRANEIIRLAEKEKKENILKETVDDYQNEVLHVKNELEESERQEFREKLEEHEQNFEKLIENTPSTKEEIERAIEAARKGQNSNHEGGELENEKVEEQTEKPHTSSISGD